MIKRYGKPISQEKYTQIIEKQIRYQEGKKTKNVTRSNER